jgi:acyl carrier protein
MASPDTFAVAHEGPAEAVRALLRTLWPHRFHDDPLPDDAPLGDGGYGLDSVEIAELLLDCEERLGVALSAELFDSEPLTIGHVVTYFSQR